MASAKFRCVLPQHESVPDWVNQRTRVVHEANGKRRENYTELETNIPIDDSIRKAFGLGSWIGSPSVPAGAHLPRVYRPNGPPLSKKWADSRDAAVHAARSVFRRMNDLFQYIE